MNTQMIVAALAAVTTALLVVAGALFLQSWLARRKHGKMMGRLQKATAGTDIDEAVSELFREKSDREPTALDYLAAVLPHSRDLEQLLEQADLDWSPVRFHALTILAAVFGAVVGWAFAGMWPMIVFGIGAGTLPYLWVLRKKKKRIEAFEEGFPEAIDLLGRSIRAGHAFSTGLQTVAEESPEPLATEFRKVFEEQKFGLPIEDSLLGLADRVDLVDVRIFVTAVLIQREVGGNLAEILDNIAATIRQRFTLQRQVRVYTAQGRLTGYLLAALPLIMLFLINMLNHEYISVLFTEDLGRLMLAAAALMQIVGFFVIRRIVNIEY